jgi:hypothetical protein
LAQAKPEEATMTERLEAARSMRENAARLREIAETETKLSADLLQIALQIEEDASRVEKSFRDAQRPKPTPGDGAAA